MSTHLAETLVALRAAVADASYPLALPDVPAVRAGREALLGQLDDYLLPRLSRLDAPLLVVVGGSTGAGKSTLVNSLVEAPVSAAGVLRPTTRAPVLVSHPGDSQWYRRGSLLPGLARTSSAPLSPSSLQLVSAPALPPGLALLDAPDIDSVVDSNRALAAQLLAAADLWLFVTTAARYADAVPWGLLSVARDRGAAIALVLDRVPPAALDEVTAHFTEMLAAHGFGGAPLFVVPEVDVGGQGLLPVRVVTPLREWLAGLAHDAGARSAVVRQTVAGAVAAACRQVAGLASAVDDQVGALQALTARVRAPYADALSTVDSGVREGALLRDEVLARWQELVGTGELFSALLVRVGRLRDRLTGHGGGSTPGRELKAALESSLGALIATAAADAAGQVAESWQALPAGSALLADGAVGAVGATVPEDLEWRARRLVRDWQRGVLTMVRTEAAGKRAGARAAAYAVNATGLLVMVGVFASTAFIPTGAEIAVAGGTTVAAQKVLEAIFGDQALRSLADRARDDLMTRVRTLLDSEASVFLGRLPVLSADLADQMRSVAASVHQAAVAADLTPPAMPALAALVPDEPVDDTPDTSPTVDDTPGAAAAVDEAVGEATHVDDTPGTPANVDNAIRESPAVDDTPDMVAVVDDADRGSPVVDDTPSSTATVDGAGGVSATVDGAGRVLPTVDEARGVSPTVDEAGGVSPTVDEAGGVSPTVDEAGGVSPIVDDARGTAALVDDTPSGATARSGRRVSPAVDKRRASTPSPVDNTPDAVTAVDDTTGDSALRTTPVVDDTPDAVTAVDDTPEAAPAVDNTPSTPGPVDDTPAAAAAEDRAPDAPTTVDDTPAAAAAVDRAPDAPTTVDDTPAAAAAVDRALGAPATVDDTPGTRTLKDDAPGAPAVDGGPAAKASARGPRRRASSNVDNDKGPAVAPEDEPEPVKGGRS